MNILDTCKVYLNVSKLSFSPILENHALISVCDMIVLIKEAEVNNSNKNKHYWELLWKSYKYKYINSSLELFKSLVSLTFSLDVVAF